MTAPGLIYRGLGRLRGPYAAVDGVPGAAFHEMVELDGGDGRTRAGQVVAVYEQGVTIEVFGPTQGLTLDAVGVRFLGHPPRVGVGPEMLGRVLDSLGRPRDGMPAPLAVEERPLDGLPLNPCRRDCPRECLETGFSAIDGLNTLTLGQKLPIFTQSGLPHDRIAAAILAQARAPGVARFAIVFAGLGLPREVAAQYETAFRRSGARAHSVMVLSLADESATERLMAPRTALTIAEYLAWDLGLHVLVILTDITNYGEALREVASARGEVPSRKGYPGYLYSDLASLFERAGRIRGPSRIDHAGADRHAAVRRHDPSDSGSDRLRDGRADRARSASLRPRRLSARRGAAVAVAADGGRHRGGQDARGSSRHREPALRGLRRRGARPRARGDRRDRGADAARAPVPGVRGRVRAPVRVAGRRLPAHHRDHARRRLERRGRTAAGGSGARQAGPGRDITFAAVERRAR